MAKSEANRGVVFTLKAKTDASVGAEFGKIGDRGAALQKKLDSLRVGIDASGFESAIDKMNREWEAFAAKIGAGLAAGRGPRFTMPSAASVGPHTMPASGGTSLMDRVLANGNGKHGNGHASVAEAEEAGGLPDRVVKARIKMLARIAEAEERAREREEKEAERTAAAQEKARMKAEAAEKKAAEKKERELERATEKAKQAAEKEAEAAEKAAEKEAKTAERLAEKKRKEAERTAADAEKQAKREEKARESAVRKAEREAEIAADKVKEAHLKISESGERAADGILSIGRSLVEVGLIGENDFGKLRDSLLKVQAIIDATRGGIDVYKSLVHGVEAYQKMVKSAAAAEESLAAARALSAAAGGASTVAGAAGSSVAGSAAAGAAGGAATTAASGGATGLIALVNPFTATVVGLLAIFAAIKYGLNRYIDSQNALIEEEEASRQKEIDIRERSNQALLAIFEAEDRARQRRNTRNTITGQMSAEFGADRQRIETEADQKGLGGSARQTYLADRQKQLDLERQSAQERERFESAQKLLADSQDKSGKFNAAPEAIEKAFAEMDAAEQRLMQLTLERGQLENEMHGHALQALQEQITLAEQELDLKKQEAQQAKQVAASMKKALDDAQASFGHLSATERAEVLRIQKKADRGEQLTDKELEKLERYGGEHGKKQAADIYRSRVTDEERRVIFGDETKHEQEARQKVGQGDQQVQAAQGRLDSLKQKAMAEEKAGGAKVSVDTSGHIKIDLAFDQKLSDRVVKQMEPLLKSWDGRVEQIAANEAYKVSQQLLRTIEQQRQRAAQTRAAKG